MEQPARTTRSSSPGAAPRGAAVHGGLTIVAAGLTAMVLAGCAGENKPVVDHLSNGRIQGDADHVSVEGGRLDSLPLAVLHCSRYGRSAQFARSENGRSVYNCVVKPQ